MPEKDSPEKGFYIMSSGTSAIQSSYLTESASQLVPAQQLLFVSKSKIEDSLNSLMDSFEKSSTKHYAVKRAKTWITTTKAANGELDVGIGVGPFRVFDANGKLRSESVQGIEIEIERREDET
jgi:hypothetical protein